MKDHFSSLSDQYAKYRPSYPKELVEYIVSKCHGRQTVWDAGTGNGQLVSKLATYFDELHATDISYEQLKNAPQISNVVYHIQPSESTTFPDEHFDLVSVAQALHWFDLTKFYSEVNRLLKPGGVFAACGYTLCQIEGLDEILVDFYANEIGEYWDPERRMVEDQYVSIPFPFCEVEQHSFSFNHQWSLDDFLGYLKTWSAVKNYEKDRKVDPVELWKQKFEKHWNLEIMDVITPVFLRIGRKPAA